MSLAIISVAQQQSAIWTLEITLGCRHDEQQHEAQYIRYKHQYNLTNNFMIHNTLKLVEQIEKKMAGPSYNKTEEEKANELFDYEPKSDAIITNKPYEGQEDISFMSHQDAQQALKEIFEFYARAYTLLKANSNNTFDQIKDRHSIMDFQSFLLFCRQFRLVNQIFSLNSIKTIYKKHSNYGKNLTYDDFMNLLTNLAHEKEAIAFFGVHAFQSPNREAADQNQLQQMWAYLSLGNRQSYLMRMKPIVEAFDSSGKVQLDKIPYNYRKMSTPELFKKALQPRKSLEISHARKTSNTQSQKNLKKPQQSKLISWETLQRAEPIKSISLNKIKTLIHEQQQDNVYLREFIHKKQMRANNLRQQIRKRIQDLTKNDEVSNKKLLEKIKRNSFLNSKKSHQGVLP